MEFNVTNQKVEHVTNEELVVNDSRDYLELEFNFNEAWDDYTKYIYFRVDGVNYPYTLVNDKIVVPNVFLNRFEKLVFGLYGILENNVRITTNLYSLPLVNSHLSGEIYQIDEEYVDELLEIIRGKVNISDIVDDLVSTDADKPLSAKQGKELKTLIDNHTHPDKADKSDFDTVDIVVTYIDDTTETISLYRVPEEESL